VPTSKHRRCWIAAKLERMAQRSWSVQDAKNRFSEVVEADHVISPPNPEIVFSHAYRLSLSNSGNASDFDVGILLPPDIRDFSAKVSRAFLISR
jgi:hypothetical protein